MEKLIAIAALGQKAYGKWLFLRLLSGIIIVIGLTIVISIMVSAVLVGSLAAAYFALLDYGASPHMAMIGVGVSAVLTIAMLVLLALTCLHHLRRMPTALLKQSPIASQAMDTLDAFTEGLMVD